MRLWSALGAGQVDSRLVERNRSPADKVCKVRRELSKRHRLGMGLPREPLLWHTLQELPRGEDLVIELREQGVGERHNASSYLVPRPKSTRGTRSASGGALNNGCSLKPNRLAVIFEGNCRRATLYSCTRSLYRIRS